MNVRLVVRLAIVVVCAVCAHLGAVVPANAAAPSQVVAGARVAAVADKIAHALVTGPDRSIAAAYQVLDQSVPAGPVELVASGSPFVSATYVGVPVAIMVDGKVARTVVAGYRITTYVQTVVAAHDLAPGAVLAPEDLTTARVAWNGRPAVSAIALLGRRMTAADGERHADLRRADGAQHGRQGRTSRDPRHS